MKLKKILSILCLSTILFYGCNNNTSTDSVITENVDISDNTLQELDTESSAETFIYDFMDEPSGEYVIVLDNGNVKVSEYTNLDIEYPQAEIVDVDTRINQALNMVANEGETVEATDEYVNEHFGNLSTMQELRDHVEQSVAKETEYTNSINKANAILACIEQNSILYNYDSALYDEYKNIMVEEIQTHASESNMTPKEWIESTQGVDYEDFMEHFIEPRIIYQIKMKYITEAIIEKENLYPTEAEIEEAYQITKETMGLTDAEAEENINIEQLKYSLANENLKTFLCENN